MGIDNRAADAHMHTVVGICERFNATLRELARAAWFDQRCQWDLYLPWALAYYNATVQTSTGYSPFYLNTGRQFDYPWVPEDWSKLKSSLATSAREYVQRHLTTMHASWDAVQRALKDTEEKRRDAHNEKYQTNVTFDVGDLVLILQPGRRSKMDPPYRGPYRVVAGPTELGDRDRYQLTDKRGFKHHDKFHVSRLRKFPTRVDGDMEVDDEDIYEVDEIIDCRPRQDGAEGVEYRIRWKGYDEADDTWEPPENLGPRALAAAHEWQTRHTNASRETCMGADDVTTHIADVAPLPRHIGPVPITPAPATASQPGRAARAAARGVRLFDDPSVQLGQ